MELKERLNLLSRDIDYITKIQVELPGIKNSMSEMKNILGGIKSLTSLSNTDGFISGIF